MIKESVRPWGRFLTLYNDGEICVKILEVHAGRKLSLQFHENRTEYWVALDDHSKLTLQGYAPPYISKPSRQEAYRILPYEKHRLEAGKRMARVLEVSLGKIDEKDIIRLEDDYGRIKE